MEVTNSMSNFYFFCKFCPRKFLSLKLSRTHECIGLAFRPAIGKENHNTAKNRDFVTDAVISEHLVKNIGETEYQSSTKQNFQIAPTEKSTSENNIDENFENQTGASFPCVICQKSLTSMDSLEIHLKIHTTFLSVPCRFPDCAEIFPSQKLMWPHMLLIHGVNKDSWKIFQCNGCEKMFKRKYELQKHKIKHMVEKPFKCTSCTKCFKDKKGFHFHRLRHQGILDFKCSDCDKSFVSKGQLNTHISENHNLRDKFKCDQCSTDFKSKGQLRQHMTIHTGVKKYKCKEGCDKQFRIWGARKDHERLHKGIKEFQCSKCPKMFMRSSTLGIHIKRHEGRKDHVCTVCGWAYVEPSGAKNCKHSRSALDELIVLDKPS